MLTSDDCVHRKKDFCQSIVDQAEKKELEVVLSSADAMQHFRSVLKDEVGIYIYWKHDKSVCYYVGKSKRLASRNADHCKESNKSPSGKRWDKFMTKIGKEKILVECYLIPDNDTSIFVEKFLKERYKPDFDSTGKSKRRLEN